MQACMERSDVEIYDVKIWEEAKAKIKKTMATALPLYAGTKPYELEGYRIQPDEKPDFTGMEVGGIKPVDYIVYKDTAKDTIRVARIKGFVQQGSLPTGGRGYPDHSSLFQSCFSFKRWIRSL